MVVTGMWSCWYWPMVASRAWLDFWFAAAAGPTAHPAGVEDELPCDDHDLFA